MFLKGLIAAALESSEPLHFLRLGVSAPSLHRDSLMNGLMCRTLGGAHAQNVNSASRTSIASQVALYSYTAGSAIALTGTVRMLVLPHAVTSGASLYIEQEAGNPE